MPILGILGGSQRRCHITHAPSRVLVSLGKYSYSSLAEREGAEAIHLLTERGDRFKVNVRELI